MLKVDELICNASRQVAGLGLWLGSGICRLIPFMWDAFLVSCWDCSVVDDPASSGVGVR